MHWILAFIRNKSGSLTSGVFCAVPSDQGGAECVLYGGQGASDCGDTYELMPGAKTLSDISACDAATVKAVGDAALVFAGSGQKANVGTSSGVKVINTAAVGKAVHSDLSFVTEEECLVACAQYVEGCTHVTTGLFPGPGSTSVLRRFRSCLR